MPHSAVSRSPAGCVPALRCAELPRRSVTPDQPPEQDLKPRSIGLHSINKVGRGGAGHTAHTGGTVGDSLPTKSLAIPHRLPDGSSGSSIRHLRGNRAAARRRSRVVAGGGGSADCGGTGYGPQGGWAGRRRQRADSWWPCLWRALVGSPTGWPLL